MFWFVLVFLGQNLTCADQAIPKPYRFCSRYIQDAWSRDNLFADLPWTRDWGAHNKKHGVLPFQMVAPGPHAGGSLSRPLLPVRPSSVTVGSSRSRGTSEWSFVLLASLSWVTPGCGAVSHMLFSLLRFTNPHDRVDFSPVLAPLSIGNIVSSRVKVFLQLSFKAETITRRQALLLKMPSIWIAGHREIQPELAWKLPPCWLASIVPEGCYAGL